MSEDAQLRHAQARVGTTLKEKWTIDALIGVGGMAVVYSATHRNKKRAAIKMLHPELSSDAEMRARFLREGYVANTVDHPGAVRVDDDDVTDDGAAFLVMELLQGETVEARAQRKGGTLPVDEVLSLADQLLDVLAAAHDKGIVHRDLKPENLFLDRSGQLKVLDFGIARLRENTERSGTQTGYLMGTPAFMPPEQARGRWDDVDGRTDLWAVGATLFTLLTGRLVHQEGGTANESLALAITQRAPALAEVMPDAPEPLAALIDRALVYEKDERFEDAHAMQQAVREAYDALHRSGADSGRMPALSLPDVAEGAGASAPVSGVPAATAVGAGTPAVQAPRMPTERGVTAAVAGKGTKKFPVVPVAIGGAALLLLTVIVIVVVAASGKQETATAEPSATPSPAGEATSVDANATAAGGPEVTPQNPDDVGAVSIDELPVDKTAKPTGTKVGGAVGKPQGTAAGVAGTGTKPVGTAPGNSGTNKGSTKKPPEDDPFKRRR